MSDELDFILEVAKDSMIKQSPTLRMNLKIRAERQIRKCWRRNRGHYGVPTIISQMANVSAIDARTLTIQPWKRTCYSQ
jgi:ribosome recycling factor